MQKKPKSGLRKTFFRDMKKCLLEMHIHLKSIHLIALTTLNFKLCITEIRERLLKGLRKKEILPSRSCQRQWKQEQHCHWAPLLCTRCCYNINHCSHYPRQLLTISVDQRKNWGKKKKKRKNNCNKTNIKVIKGRAANFQTILLP